MISEDTETILSLMLYGLRHMSDKFTSLAAILHAINYWLLV